jgi:hypothetical protein
MPTIDLYNALAMFFGLAFDRKSKLTVASSFVGSRFYLLHFNWIDQKLLCNLFLNSLVNDSRGSDCWKLWAISFRNDFRAVALLLILFTNEKQSQMDLNIQRNNISTKCINDWFDHADYWSKEDNGQWAGPLLGMGSKNLGFNYKLYAFVIHARLFLLYVENGI